MIKNKEAEILLLGLPNSGKSTLINALTKNKTSIIGSKPNTTRDKISKIVSYENDKNILISDLPGFLETPDEFNINYQNNIDKFIKDADKIFFVIDVHTKDFSGLDSIFNIINHRNGISINLMFICVYLNKELPMCIFVTSFISNTGILLENGIDFLENFNPGIEDSLPALPFVIPTEEIEKRRDYRKNCVFTIDPLTARDLDDALSIEEMENGNFKVGVHIADVSYFVT